MTTPNGRRRVSPRRGSNLENAVLHDLEDNGYRTIRAAASHGSTKADVIGIKPGQVVFVQAKRHAPSRAASGRGIDVPPAEWNALLQVASWVPGGGGVALIATGTPTNITYIQIMGVKRPGSRTALSRPFVLDGGGVRQVTAGRAPAGPASVREVSLREPDGAPQPS